MTAVWLVVVALLLGVIGFAVVGFARSMRRSSRSARAADRQRRRTLIAEQRREASAARASRKAARASRKAHRGEIDAQNLAALRALQQRQRASETIVEIETSRPTVTRTATGGLLGGPVGALVGLAWRKKRKQTIRIPR